MIGLQQVVLNIFFTFLNKLCEFANMQINWEAISAISGLIGFLMAAITIKFTEESRRKQNIYENNKEELKENQKDFEKCIKEQLDLLSPTVIYEKMLNCDASTYRIIQDELNIYSSKISKIKFNISWYNDIDKINFDIEYQLNEIEKYIKKINELHILCIKIFVEYINIDKWDKIRETVSNADELEELSKKIIKGHENIIELTGNFLDQINGDEIKKSYEDLCDMIKETTNKRNEFIKCKIEELR